MAPIFKNCFLFLKTKNIQNLFEKENTKNLFDEGDVFLFFIFSVFSKTIFLTIIKKCFYCFFTIQIINCFSCFLFFLSCFLCFHKGKVHPTTTPPPAIPFFFFKLLKLIYLHIVIKSSFKKIITGVKISKWNNFFFNLNELCI